MASVRGLNGGRPPPRWTALHFTGAVINVGSQPLTGYLFLLRR